MTNKLQLTVGTFNQRDLKGRKNFVTEWMRSLKDYRSFGYQFVELDLKLLQYLTFSEIMAILKKYRLQVSAIKFSEDLSETANLSALEKELTTCLVQLGHTQEGFPVIFDSSQQKRIAKKLWPQFVKNVQKVASYLSLFGAQLMVLPGERGCLQTTAEVQRLLAEVAPVKLQIALDTGYCAFAEEDPLEACIQWHGQLGQVYFNDIAEEVLEKIDCRRSYKYFQKQLGTGVIDYGVLMDQLVEDTAFKGNICITPTTPLESSKAHKKELNDLAHFVKDFCCI